MMPDSERQREELRRIGPGLGWVGARSGHRLVPPYPEHALLEGPSRASDRAGRGEPALGVPGALVAEGHLTRRLFGDMLRRIWALPVPAG